MADGSAGAVTRTSISQRRRRRTGGAGARARARRRQRRPVYNLGTEQSSRCAPLLTLALKSIGGRRRALWNSDGNAQRRTSGRRTNAGRGHAPTRAHDLRAGGRRKAKNGRTGASETWHTTTVVASFRRYYRAAAECTGRRWVAPRGGRLWGRPAAMTPQG